MQTGLAPIAKIPLETNVAGETYLPELAFSPDGSVLYVRQPVTAMTAVDWARWAAPEVGTALVIVGVVWLAWVIRRVMSRPRQRGRAYCRRCNYELAPPFAEIGPDGRAVWLSAEARCPECGARSGRRPAAGKPRRWRLAPWVIVGAGMLGIGVAGLNWGLEPLRPMEGPTWPVEGLESLMPGWAVQRVGRRQPDAHRINAWETATRTLKRALGAAPVREARNGLLSPDGAVYALGCGGMNPDESGWVLLIDTATGARREVPGRGPGVLVDVVGFSADSEALFVQWRTLFQSPTSAPEVILERIDLKTLERREVARVEVPAAAGLWGRYSAHMRALIDPERPERWAVVAIVTMSQQTLDVIVTSHDGIDTNKASVSVAAPSFFEPRLTERWTVELPLFGTPSVAEIDLASGAMTMKAAPAAPVLGTSPDGRLELRPGVAGLGIFDAATGAEVASLMTGQTAAVFRGVISADGRYAATTVSRLRSGAKAGSRRRGDYVCEVWLWDTGLGR